MLPFVKEEKMKMIPKKLVLTIIDICILFFSYSAALFLRFDFKYSNIDEKYIDGHLQLIVVWIVLTLVVFYICKLYHSVWRLASVSDIRAIGSAYLLLIPAYLLSSYVMQIRMPISYYLIGYILSFCATVGVRFSYRLYTSFVNHLKNDYGNGKEEQDHIMVIGAGAAGQMIVKELLNSDELQNKICCFIDDNKTKKGKRMEGIPIVGGRYDIPSAVEKYKINRIIYAIANAPAEDRKEILHICNKTGCRLQKMPGIYQLINGEVKVNQLRNVDILDLLGREQHKIDNTEVFELLSGKTVLVTGGGGSIGSELSRQIAKANPKQLVIFDIYENNAYDIQQELVKKYPELNLKVLIGSVRNTKRINDVMMTYRPDVVFHAAAHKHVPLMEDSPNEAIKNNVIGTYKTALAASVAGVTRFVLISTDKAVNPTNIMGASKRLCEMVVQMMNRQSKTEFVAVRFGNVLGSNGSVIPLFKEQIAKGGPVTVTDKNIIRYFMTIPEAVALILQASCYAQGGEIYVLDMGEPVRIDDMARNMIRLTGLTPDVDIKIVYTGLRPGEKLYEELLMEEEGLQNTQNSLIYIGKPIDMDDELFQKQIKELEEASKEESECIKELVAQIVPTYKYVK
ncbi:MAG: polysaccharide biosynthesis protein [Agathobacter sp.]|nr:polysaccharide biosynthesis protein [Agathobacter sp.]